MHGRVDRERIECAVRDLGYLRIQRIEACAATTSCSPDDVAAIDDAVAQPDDDASPGVAAARRTRLQRTIELGTVLRSRRSGSQDRADGDECEIEEVDLCASSEGWVITSKDLVTCTGKGKGGDEDDDDE